MSHYLACLLDADSLPALTSGTDELQSVELRIRCASAALSQLVGSYLYVTNHIAKRMKKW